MNQIYQSSTDIRNNFSLTIDRAVRERPQFIRRTRDRVVLISDEYLSAILESYKIFCTVEAEEDGSIVITNDAIDDIIANGSTLAAAKRDLANQLLDYAHEFYENFDLYVKASNRRPHLAYVMKILMLGNPASVEELFVCRNGKI